MGKLLTDALYTAGAVLLARWLIDDYAKRLERDLAAYREISRSIAADSDPDCPSRPEPPSPHALLGDIARPLKPEPRPGHSWPARTRR